MSSPSTNPDIVKLIEQVMDEFIKNQVSDLIETNWEGICSRAAYNYIDGDSYPDAFHSSDHRRALEMAKNRIKNVMAWMFRDQK